MTPRLLTAQQRNVLVLKANGHTTRQIADQLGITRWSVDGMMEHIFLRLGATNCPHAIAVGLKTGEITLDDVETTLLTGSTP